MPSRRGAGRFAAPKDGRSRCPTRSRPMHAWWVLAPAALSWRPSSPRAAWTSCFSSGRPTIRTPSPPVLCGYSRGLPGRRADDHARRSSDRAAPGAWPRRHDVGQFGHLSPYPTGGARSLADRVRNRSRRAVDARPFERVERALSVSEVSADLAGENAAVARRGAESARMVARVFAAKREGMRRLWRMCLRVPHLSQAAHRDHLRSPGARGGSARADPSQREARPRQERRGSWRAGAGWRRLRARGPLAVTVIAAGTLHTPSLLARSGLGLDSGQLGRNLSLHPATAAFGLMDHVVDMARGVPQSFYIDEFAREGILFEGVAGPPSYVAMALPMSGRRHQRSWPATATSRSSG